MPDVEQQFETMRQVRHVDCTTATRGPPPRGLSNAHAYRQHTSMKDEIAHHKLLVDLHKSLISPQTLTEEDLWGMLWEDSPWHGSPGG